MAVTTANRHISVTPNDSTTFEESSLYIGTSGDLALVLKGDSNSEIYKNYPVGWFPGDVVKVLATGTTATDIIRVFN